MTLVLVLATGLAFGLAGGLAFGLAGGLAGGLAVMLAFGLAFGLLKYGGGTVLQHYTLRTFLAHAKILPYPLRDRKLVAFLDAMADRILLRRRGGGWVFIHRYLLEYFASLKEPTKE